MAPRPPVAAIPGLSPRNGIIRLVMMDVRLLSTMETDILIILIGSSLTTRPCLFSMFI